MALEQVTHDYVIDSLGRLHTKVDVLLDRTATHDKQISAIQRRQWMAMPVIALMATFVTTKLKTLFGL